MVAFTLCLLIVCLCVCAKILKSNNKQPPDHGFWILNLIRYGFIYEELWVRIVRLTNECIKLGGISRLKLDRNYYLMTDPEAVALVLNSCLDKGVFYKFWRDWLGDGILRTPAPEWKVHRKLLNPMFHQRIIDSYLPIFNKQTESLVQTFRRHDGKPFIPYFEAFLKNAETLCLTSFCFPRNKETLREYCKAMEQVMIVHRERFERFWLHNDFAYNFSSWKGKELAHIKFIHSVSAEIINNRRQELQEASAKGTELLNKKLIDHLLDLQSEGVYNEEGIRQEVDNFFLAGADSTATTTTFALVLLGSYPQVQEKVYQEIMQVLASRNYVDHEDLKKLVYLEAVIKETIRLYPFAPVVARYLAQDVRIKDYTLNAGSTAYLMLHGTLRLPMWGVDADQFRPERWMEAESLPAHPAAFCGFSWGKRSCLGKAYGMLLLKTTLAHLLRNFKVSADHTKLKLELNFAIKFTSGHHITLENRV